jgi:hypothetical protein
MQGQLPASHGRRRVRRAALALAVALGWALVLSSQALALHTTTVGVSCGPAVVVGQATTCTAKVTDTSVEAPPTPTGKVAFSSNTPGGAFSSPGTECLLEPVGGKEREATCQVKYTPGEVGTGSHTITAKYAGDTTHAASAGAGAATVSKRSVLLAVGCGSEVVVGQAATCSATVTDGSPGTPPAAPAGTVTFASASGAFSPGTTCEPKTVTLTEASCSVQYTPSQTGAAKVTSSYGGDGTHTESTGAPASLTVGLRPTSVAVSCGSEVVVGQAATCTAKVTDAAAGTPPAAPSGTVTFASTSGAFSPGTTCEPKTVTLTEGSCSVQYTPSQTGTAKVTSTYGGDGTHKESTATPASLTVGPRTTSVAVICGSEVVVGLTATCTAKVTDTAPGTSPAAPSGIVTFGAESGTFSPGTSCEPKAVTVAEASCSVQYTPSQAGTAKVTSGYGGDGTHKESTGAPASLTVGKRTVATAVSCGSGLVVGQAATCTATVTDASPGTPSTPAGTMTFGSEPEGAFSPATKCELKGVNATEASCSVQYTPARAGPGQVTSSYGGDPTHTLAAGSVAVAAGTRSTQVALSCGSGGVVSVPVTCTATVTDTSETSTTPTGKVRFVSDSEGAFSVKPAECKLVPVEGKSQASCSVEYIPAHAGTAKITAEYVGDETHATAIGGPQALLVVPPTPLPPAVTPTVHVTTTPTTHPRPPRPAAPTCRVRLSEVIRTVGTRARSHRRTVLSFSYLCDQDAAVRIEATLTIGPGPGHKRAKARTVKLTPVTSRAVHGKRGPAVLVVLPAAVVKALVAGDRTTAAVKFTVQDANGMGIANFSLALYALPGTKHT